MVESLSPLHSPSCSESSLGHEQQYRASLSVPHRRLAQVAHMAPALQLKAQSPLPMVADLNSQQGSPNAVSSPLTTASASSAIPTVPLTNAIPSSIDEVDAEGNTPIMLACVTGRADVVRLLLARHASLCIFNLEGLSAIHIASQGRHAEIVDLLLRANIDVRNVTTMQGLYPLHVACAASAPDVMSVLLKWGATVNVLDRAGSTPLMYAVRAHAIGCARLLLQAGAETTAQDVNGWTALHWAASVGDRRLAQLLLQHKAPMDAVTVRMQTPLMLAVRESNEDVVRLLLERFAKRKEEDCTGKTALDYARATGQRRVVALMQDFTLGSRSKGVVQRQAVALAPVDCGSLSPSSSTESGRCSPMTEPAGSMVQTAAVSSTVASNTPPPSALVASASTPIMATPLVPTLGGNISSANIYAITPPAPLAESSKTLK